MRTRSQDEQRQRIGEVLEKLHGYQHEECECSPNAIVQYRIKPVMRSKERRSSSNDERKPSAQLDSLHDRDGQPRGGPALSEEDPLRS
ncbi:hypothetical protein E4U32_005688 [Claviceps aff. humidiphila group G2b]|nr:hypothetical protein E4U32_005688 [Claviceps aff. humidiphila group G2b]